MKRSPIFLVVLILAAAFAGCGGSNMTSFIHEEYNFGFVERVAVIPFDNLSEDRGAGARATNLFLAEMLAAKAFDVVEPGEVARVLAKQATVRASELSTEQIQAIGRELKVQALFFGIVNESMTYRDGSATAAKINMTVRMVETEKGETVWSSSATAGGRGFFSTLFGTGDQSSSQVTRKCVKKILGTLFD